MTAAGGVVEAGSVRGRRRPARPTTDVVALAYVGLPSLIFLAGWIRPPWGLACAVAVLLSIVAIARRDGDRGGEALDLRLRLVIVVVASLWIVVGGLGHWLYANPDWITRDAVLLDLVRRPWPVAYDVDGVEMLLRAPIGYFLPASLVGKVSNVRVAEGAQVLWTLAGVSLVFRMMLRDRPGPGAVVIRLGVFIVFSGMDLLGQIAHYNPHAIGDHLEWWAYLFQYSSQTTQLFWVPNHALPGWIAIAWLLGRDRRRLPVATAILFVIFTPLWSPLTAIGLAPIVGAAVLRQWLLDGPRAAARSLVDWRLLVPLIACVALIYPYLVAGSEKIASGRPSDLRWVSEDFVPRYIEFVVFEFAGFAILLLKRDLRDPWLWAAIGVLLALPFYRFGPFNDLAMRASIPALTLLAIRIGLWLSQPVAVTRDRPARAIAIALLAVGAVTPFMEWARAFIEPRWTMNDHASVIDVTRGSHYLTPLHQPWADRFLRPVEAR